LQAVLQSPMFTNRWRWNIGRSLALPRFAHGRKVPMALQRMRAEDLLSAVFPEQVMCQDNRSGPIEPPDHPLVNETLRDCLQEAMDALGLHQVIARLENGTLRTRAVETPAPSPMSHEILNANPYAFLDDAPLEERRARAVSLRRIDPAVGGVLSAEAIDEVRGQAWPQVRDANDLHDLLLALGVLPDASEWPAACQALLQSGRMTRAMWPGGAAWVAAERMAQVKLVFPQVAFDPELPAPPAARTDATTPEDAVRRMVSGWMDILGPVSVPELAQRSGLPLERAEWGLLALEAGGRVLRGHFARQDVEEWCERGLLARIHRLTLGRLRREIEPVSAADFIRFLLRWQHVHPGTQLHGQDGLVQIVGQLQGLELPAPAWEESVLPARLAQYNGMFLEQLCLAGAITWGRLRLDEDLDEPQKRRGGPGRSAPLGLLLREDLRWFASRPDMAWEQMEAISGNARQVAQYLQQHGATFLTDLSRGVNIPMAWVEEALWELVARGLVTGDGVAGLRSLLGTGSTTRARFMPLGRWALWRPPSLSAEEVEKRPEVLARQLLRRYGVVVRELLAREGHAPPWRELLSVFRLLEAQGEVRGGRFVSGFVGEQYARPEAVEALRGVRRRHDNAEAVGPLSHNFSRPPYGPETAERPGAPGRSPERVVVAAADPLNLVGILTPGARLSPYVHQAIVYQDGVPIETGPSGLLLRRVYGGPALTRRR
ncbi:MAG: Lhr family helicase, partial [Candidatus Xenobia bacterium]